MEKLTFAKRVKLAEKRLGIKLPITYVKFIKDFVFKHLSSHKFMSVLYFCKSMVLNTCAY